MIRVKTWTLSTAFWNRKKNSSVCIWCSQRNVTMPVAGEMISLLNTTMINSVDKKILEIQNIWKWI